MYVNSLDFSLQCRYILQEMYMYAEGGCERSIAWASVVVCIPVYYHNCLW